MRVTRLEGDLFFLASPGANGQGKGEVHYGNTHIFYCGSDKKEVGPFNMTQMRKMLLHGIVRPGSLIRRGALRLGQLRRRSQSFMIGSLQKPQDTLRIITKNTIRCLIQTRLGVPARHPTARRTSFAFSGSHSRATLQKAKQQTCSTRSTTPEREAEYEQWKAAGEPPLKRTGLLAKGCIGVTVILGILLAITGFPPSKLC